MGPGRVVAEVDWRRPRGPAVRLRSAGEAPRDAAVEGGGAGMSAAGRAPPITSLGAGVTNREEPEPRTVTDAERII